METSEAARRTAEIEEITNLYLIHPISSFLTPIFARLGISPNAVSLTGMLFGILAGLAYYHFRDPRWAAAGFILMVAWHVLDGADGQLARLTRKQSELGKILDGICDYVTFTAVYAALAAALVREMGGWAWPLAFAAGLCHALQAAAYETQRQEYDFWGWDRKSKELVMPPAEPAAGTPRLMAALHRLYVLTQFRLPGLAVDFRRRLATMLRVAAPEREMLIRRRYREIFAPVIRRWSILSANYRTLGLFAAALAGRPQYYFLFEIVGFTIILAILIAYQRSRYRLFFRTLPG